MIRFRLMVAGALMISTASVQAQMACDAGEAENLRRLQDMKSQEADLAHELLAATYRMDANSVIWLLEKGAPVDARSDGGSTPLMLLVMRTERGEDDSENGEDLSGGVEVVPWPCARERREAERRILDALMRRSPELDARNSEGSTALLIAAAGKRFDLVVALQHAGANINAADRRGETAIFQAPRVSLKSLVEAGADINAANKNGDTILHVKMRTIAGRRLIDFVNTAIKLGARDSRNKRGEWASEQMAAAGWMLPMHGGPGPLDAVRKRIKATRPDE